MAENQSTQQQRIHKIFFVVSAISFTIATISSSFFSGFLFSIILYKMSFQFYSLLMIYTEYLHLQISQKHKWSYQIFITNAIGYMLYFISAVYYDHYNQGILYMCAAFLVIVATESNIFVMLLYSEKSLWNIIKDDKDNVMIFLWQGIANSLFLISTMVKQSFDKEQINPIYSSILNIMSGIAIQGAVYSLLVSMNYKGYRQFDSIRNIPKIT